MDNIQRQIEELKATIRYHSDKYYNQDEPEIEDYEYDALMHRLIDLEERYPQFRTPDSPTLHVGGAPSSLFTPVEHTVRMESLQDGFGEADVRAFEKRVSDAGFEPLYVVEPKIDGLSVSLEYVNGRFVRGSTRGDGDVGEDITENLRKVRSVPMKLNRALPFIEVRGEVYMSRDVFLRLTAEQELHDEKPFKNPRNAAAGSLRQKDPKVTEKRMLDIFVFNIQQVEGAVLDSHKESIAFLSELGFSTVPFCIPCESIDECLREIEIIGEKRGSFDFDIDGAVIKIDDFETRAAMGSTSKFPKWALAYKYPPEEKETTLRDIEVAVGRTGVLTPTAVFDTITLAGTSVTRATLHNQDFIDEKGISIGDRIVVRKAGEIIPEVLYVSAHTEGNGVYKLPKKCPSCGSEVIREEGEAAVRCVNVNCPAQLLRNLIHFCSRDAMDMEGFGEAVLTSLVQRELVKTPADLFTLRAEDISSIERMGDKSAANLLAAAEKAKENDLSSLLFALGIRHIGAKAGQLLAEHFLSMDAVMDAKEEQILEIDGFGEIMAKSVVQFFELGSSRELIERFRLLGLNMRSKKEIIDERFKGMTFVLTGTLSKYKRAEASKIIESYGGKTSSSVSKKTTYVLAGEDAGSKLDKANSLGIAVISEDEFEGMTE